MSDPVRDAPFYIQRVIDRLQMDIDDGGRPDQWSMQDMQVNLRAALEALAAAPAQPTIADPTSGVHFSVEHPDGTAVDFGLKAPAQPAPAACCDSTTPGWHNVGCPTLAAAPAQPMTCDGCGKPVRPLLCGHCAPASEPQAEPQPEAIPIAPVEVVRQALKELLESISECRMDQVTARFAKASVMARAVVDRYKDAT